MITTFEKIDPNAVYPLRATEGSAGFDLCAFEYDQIEAGEILKVRTGLKIKLPRDHAALVLPRSGLAIKQGVTVLNAPGLIDSDYEGEIQVILHRVAGAPGDQYFSILPGDKIAQLMIVSYASQAMNGTETNYPAAHKRGEGGFGSTGF